MQLKNRVNDNAVRRRRGKYKKTDKKSEICTINDINI